MKTAFVFSGILSFGTLMSSPTTLEINTGWKFRQARLTNWYDATVPGTVHTDLLNNGIIEDPYFKLNERGLQWIDKEDWVYSCTFDIPDEVFSKKNVRLNFKGLDTYADVYLNDTEILDADNMFREWNIDVKNIIKKSDNELKIFFHSPIKMDIPKWDSLPFQYEASNDQSENGGVFNKKVSVFARKAGYHYGWDWGPRLVTSGIWRPILLEAWGEQKIENIFYLQEKVTKKSAEVITIVEILSDTEDTNAIIKVEDAENGKTLGQTVTTLKKGLNKISIKFIIKNPELWWSNGLGNAHLYQFRTSLALGSSVIDAQVTKIGLRSLKLITQPDKDGETFYFELNGVPVFAKGANYIPNDNFLPRVTKKIYEKSVLDAVNANMNMLRVWGGGIYEDDYFYELCDQFGIMVWQDFMFACSLYPFEGKFKENVKQEAIDNVRRLRNHASIALWCGNNECNEAWFGWGWKSSYEKQNPSYSSTIWTQFCNQYDVVLPEIVSEHMPGTAYRPSSPFSVKNEKSNRHTGDNHYWSVWHAKAPINDYNTVKSRFFSEYGFQSFPELISVKQYNPDEKDWDIYSEVMMAHQRGGNFANNRIKDYLLEGYPVPKNFESFLYMNLILQGDAIKTAIEAHRRDMPYCMGSVYWQHNDCWPVASWSSRDYYGRWKAQHYFAREAFKNILVSAVELNNMFNVYVVSDKLNEIKASLNIQLLNLDGTVLKDLELSLKIKANSSKKVWSIAATEFLKNNKRQDLVVVLTLKTSTDEVFTNNYFMEQQKNMNFYHPTISYKIEPVDNGYEITLNSDKFARGVYLSAPDINCFFDKNFFDLTPKKTVTVKALTNLSLENFQDNLKILSITDAYNKNN